MRNLNQINSDCIITGQPLEDLTSKEEMYELMYESEAQDFEPSTYPQWFQEILDSPYEIILEMREEFLHHALDPRYLRILDRAAHADYCSRYKSEIYASSPDTESDDCIYEQAANYEFDNYYYNVWLEQQSDEVEEFLQAAA